MKDTCKTNKIPVIRQNPIKYQRNGLALAWHRTAPPPSMQGTYGGWPFVLVPRLYHGKSPTERWDSWI